MEFENQMLELDQLPKVGELEFKALHPDYLQVSILSALVQWIIILAIMITGLSFGGYLFDLKIFLGSLGIWLLLMAVSLVFRWLGFRHKSYAIREKDIHYKSGLIWRSETSIPFHRVQHAEVSQGLIERMFKLGRLKVFTAGGESSDLVVPGLQPDQAARLKAYVLKKSGLEDKPDMETEEQAPKIIASEEVSPLVAEQEVDNNTTEKEEDANE